jgi:hypothetical protein
MTPAQHDIQLDFDHLKALCMHSWSEREVVAAIERLQKKVQAEQRARDEQKGKK